MSGRKDGEKRSAYQQLQDHLTDNFLDIASGDFPRQYLANALRALNGEAVPLPNNTESVLLPKLHGGILDYALASDGTVAVVGRHRGGDKSVVLLVADTESTKFVKVDDATNIGELFFPEN